MMGTGQYTPRPVIIIIFNYCSQNRNSVEFYLSEFTSLEFMVIEFLVKIEEQSTYFILFDTKKQATKRIVSNPEYCERHYQETTL